MRKIVLFGTGHQAEKFVFEYGKQYEIMYILDFGGEGRKFLGKYEVYEPTAENCSKYFIICAGDYYMSKMCKFLNSIGKTELKDYIWYEWDNKKMVVINANCYGPHIKNYLKCNSEFNDNFYFYPVPTIHQNKEKNIDEHIIKNCDIFLHQDVRADNSFYKLSDDYLIPRLSEKAMSITIPNLVGYGKIFFIQSMSHNKYNRAWPNTPFGLFPHGDAIIDTLCMENVSLDYIVSRCRNAKYFTKSELEDNLNSTYIKFKQRENMWDIKILDYIMCFYREKKVFYDVVHPSNFIIRKICEDILKLLGINSKLPLIGQGLNSFEVPLYPEVKDLLGLEWGGEDEIIREKSVYKLRDCDMDMEEYIREYVYWCHTERF